MMKIYGLVFNLFTFYKFETRETLSENIFTAAAHKTQRPVRRTGGGRTDCVSLLFAAAVRENACGLINSPVGNVRAAALLCCCSARSLALLMETTTLLQHPRDRSLLLIAS